MSTPAAPNHNHNHDSRGLLGRVTDTVTNRALDTLHPDLILDHVDVNAIVERIDIEELLGRVDLNELLDRVDVDKLVDRIDVQRLIDRVDIQQLIGRSGIPDIVRESTGQVAGSALDVGRRQVVGLDFLAERLVDRLVRRDRSRFPSTPPLVEPQPSGVTGHYAGGISRGAAAALDVLVIMTVYTVGYAAVGLLADAFLNVSLNGKWSGLVSAIALGTWAFLYYCVSLAVAGRTAGMALLGLRALRTMGSPLTVRSAIVRTVVMPLSAVLALGFLLIFVDRRHRALHDVIAGTLVVYDWGERSARLPGPLSDFLAKREAGRAESAPAELSIEVR